MNLNENLLRSFAKAVNAPNRKETKLYYGTITRVEETDGVRVPYVHLDGSEPNSETPLVEGTEVRVDDRVIVTIENHKAVVMSNITSPASARTASNYMDLVEEESTGLSGLKIGDMTDDEHDFNVLITSDGVYIRNGTVPLTKYTSEGIEFGLQEDSNHNVIRTRLAEGLLEMFSNWHGQDDYSSRVAVAPGFIEVDDGTYYTQIMGGRLESNDNALVGGYLQTSFKGTLSLGACCVPVTYTSSGTAMIFTIPMPFAVTSSLTGLSFNCTVRCDGHYLIQLTPSTHSGASIVMGQSNGVYFYGPNGDVERTVTLTATKYFTGIHCTITVGGADDYTGNGLNNHAAVALLTSIQATFA